MSGSLQPGPGSQPAPEGGGSADLRAAILARMAAGGRSGGSGAPESSGRDELNAAKSKINVLVPKSADKDLRIICSGKDFQVRHGTI